MRFNPSGMVGFNGVPMSRIAQLLTQSVGRPVIDKTGLTGLHDFTLKFAPEAVSGPFSLPQPGANVQPPSDPNAPNVYTAVQEQLGLKLENARAPVEVVVIDRFEKPAFD